MGEGTQEDRGSGVYTFLHRDKCLFHPRGVHELVYHNR